MFFGLVHNHVLVTDERDEGTDAAEPRPTSSQSRGPKHATSLARTFWYLVILFNIAILTFSLGVLVIVFENHWVLGIGLLFVGVTTFTLGYYQYRFSPNTPP